MPKKIYVVTSGTYSDYKILAPFSTRDKARAFIKRKRRNSRYEHYVGDDYRIETWEVDKPLEPKIPIFFCYYFPDNDSWKVFEHEECSEFNVVKKDVDSFGETEGYMYWVAKKAQDTESALKMANEEIMQFVAKELPEDAIPDSEDGVFRLEIRKNGPRN